MAAGLEFEYAPECSCGAQGVIHSPHCDYRHYVQGYMDGICALVGSHLHLDHLDGRCARCSRYENGTLPT